MPPWGVRKHDQAMNYVGTIDGVRIQVIALDGSITAGYPLGVGAPPSDFIQIAY